MVLAETSDQLPPAAHFTAAPALEAVFALNALAHPDRRPFAAAWAAGVAAALTPPEQACLALIRQLPEQFAPGDLAVRHRCLHDPDALAAAVAGQSPAAFAAVLLGDVLTPEQLGALQADPDGAGKLHRSHPWLLGGDPALLALVLGQAAALQAAYVTLLPRVWALGVAPMLDRLEPIWAATLARARAEAAGQAPAEFSLAVFSKPFGRRYGPGHQFGQFVFVPSYFVSPLRVVMFDPEMAVLTLDCRLGPLAVRKARDRVAAGLRALAEENRLEILRLLMHDQGFGGWVAKRLKLKPATVTHHLAILRAAGLVAEAPGPPGAAKYHRTDRAAVQRLLKLLTDYLDNALEPDWDAMEGGGGGGRGNSGAGA